MIDKLIDFCENINSSNSRLYKVACLKKYAQDEDVKSFLKFLFNPYIVTGISTKKLAIMDTLEYEVHNSFNSLFECLDFVSKNNTGSYAVLQEVAAYLHTLTENQKEFVRKLLCKNIQLGIECKTINSVIHQLVPEFNIQLAEKFFDHPEYIEGKEFALTTKIDGGRIIAIKENGVVSMFTRAGQPYEGLVDIENTLMAYKQDNFVIDGEITLLNKGKLNSKEQYKATMKIVRCDGVKHGVKIRAFDCMPVEDFKNQLSTQTYNERRAMLDSVVEEYDFIEVLPILYQGSDTKKIYEILDQQVASGEEGIMINDVSAVYDFKRSRHLLKCKKMQDIDLPIIGFEEGTNRNANKLGALIVDFEGNRVKVGTGLSDELRAEIWNNQSNYLGVTVAVKYFEVTTNDKGGKSLRFPVFIDFRWDKPCM